MFKLIKESVDIEEVIERFASVEIKNHFCNCPFHNEKTASLSISQRKQIFTCFGCGITGDSITFVQNLLKVNVKEAALLISDEFKIGLRENNLKISNREIEDRKFEKRRKEAFKKWCNDSCIILSNEQCKLWRKGIIDYEWYKLDCLTEILINGTDKEKKNIREEVNKYVKQLSR